MEKFVVIKTTDFDEKAGKLTSSEKERVSRILDQLTENGDIIGKPLG